MGDRLGKDAGSDERTLREAEWELLGLYDFEVESDLDFPEPEIIEVPVRQGIREELYRVDDDGLHWRLPEATLYPSVPVDSGQATSETALVRHWMQTWTHDACISMPGLKGLQGTYYSGGTFNFWGSDGRELLNHDDDYDIQRRRKVVALYRRGNTSTAWSDVGSDYHCSGVLVGESVLLTAAHCVTEVDPGPNAYKHNAPAKLRACTLGNRHAATVNGQEVPARCSNIQSVTAASNWLLYGYPTADVAVVHLHQDLGNDVGFMSLADDGSDATTSVVHSASYSPWWRAAAGDCDVAQIDDVGQVDDTNLNTLSLVIQNGTHIYGTNTNAIYKARFDGGNGHSGSPIFWCPDGAGNYSCDSGDPGHVLGIWSAWDDATSGDEHHAIISVPFHHSWISAAL